MSVIQENHELRFIDRKQLSEEARIISNYYRDIIHAYGINCQYFYKKLPFPEIFSPIISQNNLLIHAYGYDADTEYGHNAVSASLITYMTVDNDIFNLTNLGLTGETTVKFYFDALDFATNLAYKLGQIHEFKIHDKKILEPVNSLDDISNIDKIQVPFTSDILSGEIIIDFSKYDDEEMAPVNADENIENPDDVIEPFEGFELNKEYTIPVDTTNLTAPVLSFPVNKDLYKSFNYNLIGNSADDVLSFFTFKIITKDAVSGENSDDKEKLEEQEKEQEKEKATTPELTALFAEQDESCEAILSGYIHGAVLFRDITKISKYKSLVKPAVGDIIVIDYPNEKSRDQYQITECTNRDLTTTGINPLLHNYVWQCTAVKYIPSHENIDVNHDDNEQLDDKINFINNSSAEIGKLISNYEHDEDDVYGGYDLVPEELAHSSSPDLNAVGNINNNDSNSDDGESGRIESFFPGVDVNDPANITILDFNAGSRLFTDGFDLYFLSSRKPDTPTKIQKTLVKTSQTDYSVPAQFLTTDLEFIKATDYELTFTDIQGKSYTIVENRRLSENEYHKVNMAFNSLVSVNTFTNGKQQLNVANDSFFKFSNCNTYLYSDGKHLYCKLGNSGLPASSSQDKIIKII